jgi:predicted PurR-regulated permease PerM
LKPQETISSSGRAILVCAAVVIVIAGMKIASGIIAPLLMAGFISIICSAPLYWLKGHGLNNTISLIIILAGVGLLGIAVFSLIANSLDAFSDAIPRYKQNLGLLYNDLNDTLTNWGYALPIDGLREHLSPNSFIRFLNYMLSGLSNILGDGLVVFLGVLFILTEVASLPDKLRASLKNPEHSMVYFDDFIRKVIHYLGLKAATSTLTAVCVALVLWVLNIDYVFLWAVLAFFLNFIPYVGSFLAGLPAVLLGLVDHGIFVALWAAAGYIAINIIVGNIIETRWMGDDLNLSSFIVFVSLIFWGWVLGPTGMFLSIPLTMSITIALESNPETRSIALMMQNADAIVDTRESDAKESEQG